MENKENKFTENAELSDDELDSVSGGFASKNVTVDLTKPQYVTVNLTSTQQRIKERLKEQWVNNGEQNSIKGLF
ncbi:MAG: hypothetical protein K2J71_09075 [Oscillospiraceae bacterium]|nr:hypothetical protein [Oscillospiraceae bacterium]